MIQITDEQDETGRTTYSVVLDHMDHGVTVLVTEDRDLASSVHFAIGHELARVRREAFAEAARYLREDADVVGHQNPYAGDDGNATLRAAAEELGARASAPF